MRANCASDSTTPISAPERPRSPSSQRGRYTSVTPAALNSAAITSVTRTARDARIDGSAAVPPDVKTAPCCWSQMRECSGNLPSADRLGERGREDDWHEKADGVRDAGRRL